MELLLKILDGERWVVGDEIAANVGGFCESRLRGLTHVIPLYTRVRGGRCEAGATLPEGVENAVLGSDDHLAVGDRR